MPLAWAHAEYIRLLRSLKERKVWDMPPQTVERYQVSKKSASFAIWTFEQQRKRLPAGKNLRVDCLNPAQVRWSVDGWKTAKESKTVDSELGIHYAVLDTATLGASDTVSFTFYWPESYWLESGRWEGRNFEVTVV